MLSKINYHQITCIEDFKSLMSICCSFILCIELLKLQAYIFTSFVNFGNQIFSRKGCLACVGMAMGWGRARVPLPSGIFSPHPHPNPQLWGGGAGRRFPATGWGSEIPAPCPFKSPNPRKFCDDLSGRGCEALTAIWCQISYRLSA